MNILHNYIKLLSNNFEYGATSQSRALARFDLERSKLWRRLQMYDMFFAFTFRALFFILSSKCNAPHRVVFNSYSTTSRSSSHLLLLKGLFFGHAFFLFLVYIIIVVVVSIVIILPSSKFIFVVPMSRRVSTRGCFNRIFSVFLYLILLCSISKTKFSIRYSFFSIVATLLMRHENSFSRVHVSLTFIISIFVSVPLIIKKRDCGLRCTNRNEINTNFYFYSIFVVAAADFFMS